MSAEQTIPSIARTISSITRTISHTNNYHLAVRTYILHHWKYFRKRNKQTWEL